MKLSINKKLPMLRQNECDFRIQWQKIHKKTLLLRFAFFYSYEITEKTRDNYG